MPILTFSLVLLHLKSPQESSIASIMACMIDSNRQADSTTGDHCPADGSKESMDNVMSLRADEVLPSTESIEADIDSAAVQPSRVSLRRRRAPSESHQDSFCSDCELIISIGHILKCQEPSCTEKVCL